MEQRKASIYWNWDMKRYLQLYYYFLKFSLSKALHFRIDFTFRIFMDLFFYASLLFFYKVIFHTTHLFAGWTSEQMQIFLATYFLIDAIDMTFIATNLWWLPIYVNRGDLDYHLIRPVSALFFLSLKEFAANSFLNFIITLAYLLWNILHYSCTLTVYNVLSYLLLICNGILMLYLIHFLFIIPIFFTQSPRGLEDLYLSMTRFLQNPEQIYAAPLRWCFKFLLPLSVIVSFPVQFLFNEGNWIKFGQILGITLVYILMIAFLWKKALEKYSSSSS